MLNDLNLGASMRILLLVITLIASPFATAQDKASSFEVFAQWAKNRISHSSNKWANSEKYVAIEGVTPKGKTCGLFITDRTSLASMVEFYLSLGFGPTIFDKEAQKPLGESREDLFVGSAFDSSDDIEMSSSLIKLKDAYQDDTETGLSIPDFKTELNVELGEKMKPLRAKTTLINGEVWICIFPDLTT